MLFNSVNFLFIFFPVTVLSYFVLPEKSRNFFLLLASLLFYSSAKTSHVTILTVSMLTAYGCGLKIASLRGRAPARRLVLGAGLVLNLGLLVYFKYFNFLIDNLNRLLELEIKMKPLALPVGLSFFIFKSIAYLVDVYYGKIEANRNIIDTSLYIAMFPQLLAGPISRYSDVSAQLAARRISLEGFSEGASRFIIGLAKKVLIADVLAETADGVFLAAGVGLGAGTAWLGLLCYSLQIYFDFSGYSDMAIGLGRMFGFKYGENFNYPYLAASVTEFWRRWHISLSSWFRDYLYIPLGGNRRGHVYAHLLIVFCAVGFWHGAAWNFLFWGLWHGLFLILEKIVRPTAVYKIIPVPLRWAVTMLAVMLGWVLFRTESLAAAAAYAGWLFHSFDRPPFSFSYFVDRRLILALAFGFLFSAPLWPRLSRAMEGRTAWAAVKTPLLTGLFALSLVFVVNGGYRPFIYFRF
jgi:alginate O-acetyltransferase complex protein AlgI